MKGRQESFKPFRIHDADTLHPCLLLEQFNVWDVGGQDKIRPLWRHYYTGTQVRSPLPSRRSLATKSSDRFNIHLLYCNSPTGSHLRYRLCGPPTDRRGAVRARANSGG